jgi:hypothetical protein
MTASPKPEGDKEVELSALRRYSARMGISRRLGLKSRRVRRARAVPDDWPNAAVGLRPGINEVAASVPIAVPEPSDSVRYPLDFDIGEVADGYHLIARGVSLRGANLTSRSSSVFGQCRALAVVHPGRFPGRAFTPLVGSSGL